MTCLTFSTSTANWIADRQFRSVCTTTFAMLRWTNTSPGAMSMIWLAGTRESEQPIQRYSGARCFDRRSKKPGSSAWMRAAHSRLRSSRGDREYGMASVSSGQCNAHVAGIGEEAHRLHAAFAAQPRGAGAAERRAQVAHQPGVDPDHARLQFRRHQVRAHQVAGPHRG